MIEDRELADLEATVRRFGEAWAAGDAAALAAMLAPGYTHVDASGAMLDREEWLRYAAGRAGRGTTIAFPELAVRRHGDVAIVTGVNEVGGGGVRSARDARGLSIRFTQVWIRKDGRWLREAMQGTEIGSDIFA